MKILVPFDNLKKIKTEIVTLPFDLLLDWTCI